MIMMIRAASRYWDILRIYACGQREWMKSTLSTVFIFALSLLVCCPKATVKSHLLHNRMKRMRRFIFDISLKNGARHPVTEVKSKFSSYLKCVYIYVLNEIWPPNIFSFFLHTGKRLKKNFFVSILCNAMFFVIVPLIWSRIDFFCLIPIWPMKLLKRGKM